MTAEERKKIQEAIDLISCSLDNQDGGWRAEMGVGILNSLLAMSDHNPFTEHGRNDE